MKSGYENLNGAGTFVSDKVHLDEIAVRLDSLVGPQRLDVARESGLIACRSPMAPI
jgi:hypothetical protein